MTEEIVLKENKNRFTVFPIKYHDIWKLYEMSIANFWTVEEIDFSKDLDDYQKLTDDEKFFIKNVLAFFAASDGIVNENLILNFYNEVQLPEMRQFYASQIMIESIHSHCYSLMIETYIKDEEEKAYLFNSIETNPIVKKKSEWALKWITKGTFSQRLVGFIVVEGIFFAGSFCAIYWLKSRGIMPGLTLSNEFISRDETLHANGGITLYSYLQNKLSEEEIHSIFKEAVEIEKEFITESLPVKLIGMNSKLMIQYIEYISDFWLIKMKYKRLHGFFMGVFLSSCCFYSFSQTQSIHGAIS
jgi:ribonucleoside-diphosphate reductase beta chain